MKKVEPVRPQSEITRYGRGKGTKYGFGGVEEAIKEWVEKGWDYCGFVPIKTRGIGHIDGFGVDYSWLNLRGSICCLDRTTSCNVRRRKR